jgi:NTP pyrophosphatase (non-canonical NTP hydrolase)
MDYTLSGQVIDWHLTNGGFCDTPEVYKHHTLRLLHEATELCLAAGANDVQILEVCNDEISKHLEKVGCTTIDLENMVEEVADVAILLEVFAQYTEIFIDDAVHDKLGVLLERQWTADEHGVLWRKKEEEPSW